MEVSATTTCAKNAPRSLSKTVGRSGYEFRVAMLVRLQSLSPTSPRPIYRSDVARGALILRPGATGV